jgi:hypothetical protein
VNVIAEERDRLLHGFEHAAGFRLERQHDLSPRSPPDVDERRRVSRNVLGNLPHRARTLSERFECSGHGRDRAHLARGQQGRKNLGGPVGVSEALGSTPVRLVHIFLHPPTMERTVRESVDGEDVETVAVKKTAELVERGRRTQGIGGNG